MTRHSYPYPFQPDPGPEVAHGWAIIVLLLLLLAAVLYFAPRDVSPPGALLSPAVNPELQQVQRYQAMNSAQSGASFEARFPQLQLVDRYQSEQAATYMAQNPELRAFFAHLAHDGRLNSAFPAQNPEVGLYRRHLAENRR